MTLTYAVTDAPTDLVAALALVVGTSYLVEVVSGNPACRVFEGGNAAPTDRSYFHTVQPGRALGVKPKTGQKVWVWSTGPSRLVATEMS